MKRPRIVALVMSLALLALGLVTLTHAVGCESTQAARQLDPINAEQKSLEHTKVYAKSYVKEYPTEKLEVDDFYASWQGRLDSEKKAAPDAPAVSP